MFIFYLLTNLCLIYNLTSPLSCWYIPSAIYSKFNEIYLDMKCTLHIS